MRTKVLRFQAAVFLLVFFGWTEAALSSEKLSDCDFAAVKEAALRLAARYGGPGNVLVVYDVDNTLLKSCASLGSDQWFNWQSDLIGKVPSDGPSPYLAADSVPELLKVQGMLFVLGSMAPPDPRAPGIVKELQDSGFLSMVCTSRSPETQEATLRELRRNGYEFEDHCPGPERCGLFKLDENGSPVAYVDGVLMTAGQNKGLMLTAFLKSLTTSLKSVVLLDDSLKNTDQVYDRLSAAGLDPCVIRYGYEDSVVADFKANRDGVQDLVKCQWEKLKGLIRGIWGRTLSPQPALRPAS